MINLTSDSSTRRSLVFNVGLLAAGCVFAPVSSSAAAAGTPQDKMTTHPEQKGSPLKFILDKNLELPTEQGSWLKMLTAAGIHAEATTDLVHIDELLKSGGPDFAYVPGADFVRLVLENNPYYDGLVIATSKFTRFPYQTTLLVVRKDDPATSIEDLKGSKYGYMNKSCSSSYFPPAIMLQSKGQDLNFLDAIEVAGWQPRVDAVISGKIRSTMILEDVWKMTPSNADKCKIIGSMDGCPPAILAVNKRVDRALVSRMRDQALSYIPSWQTVYGSFRPYSFADVQTFAHYLSLLPSNA